MEFADETALVLLDFSGSTSAARWGQRAESSACAMRLGLYPNDELRRVCTVRRWIRVEVDEENGRLEIGSWRRAVQQVGVEGSSAKGKFSRVENLAIMNSGRRREWVRNDG